MTASPPLDPNPAFLPTAPPYDDASLASFAQFLAKEMDYLACIASGHTVRWYRDQIGPEICSAARAARLRSLTTAACLEYAKKHRVPLPGSEPRVVSIDRDAGRIHLGLVDAPPPSTLNRRVVLFAASVVGVLGAAVMAVRW